MLETGHRPWYPCAFRITDPSKDGEKRLRGCASQLSSGYHGRWSFLATLARGRQ